MKLIFCFFIILIFALLSTKLKKRKHIRYRLKARKIYRKINSIDNDKPLWLITYLRKINPYVFEELILYAFKQNGWRIRRNRSYSHDGGIDGKVYCRNKEYFIQAKRYSSYINLKHLEDFINICKSHHVEGFFVHTGKTGEEARTLASMSPEIRIISGRDLCLLFLKNHS